MAEDFANSSFYQITGVSPIRQTDFNAKFTAAEGYLEAANAAALSVANSAVTASSTITFGVASGLAQITTATNTATDTVAAAGVTAQAGAQAAADAAALSASSALASTTFLAPYTGAVSRTWANKVTEEVSVKDFGAVGDNATDDTAAFQAAINAASSGILRIPKGNYKLTDELVISQPMIVRGTGHRFGSRLFFNGSSTRTVKTAVTHPADGTDPAINCAIRITSANVTMEDLYVVCAYTGLEAAGVFGADYDTGIFVQSVPFFHASRVRVDGYWRKAGIYYDVTAGGGNCDGSTLNDVWSKGFWGLHVQGAKAQVGQPMNSGDTRGAGGMSDFSVTNCRFYGMEHTSTVRASDTDGGACKMDGQVGPNSLNLIQGHRFYGTRFQTREPYALYIGNSARDIFIGCHAERSSGLKVDGVTTITKSMVQWYISPTARFPRMVGTDISAMGISSILLNPEIERFGCHEEGIAVPDLFQSVGNMGAFASGTYSPTVTGSTGQFTAGSPYNVREGNWTRQGRTITVSIRVSFLDVTGLAGNVSISLPFASASTGTTVASVITSAVNFSTDGLRVVGLVSAGASTIVLYRERNNAAITNLSSTFVTASSSFWVNVTYLV